MKIKSMLCALAFYPLVYLVLVFPVTCFFIWLAQTYPKNPIAAHAYWLMVPLHLGFMISLLGGAVIFALDMNKRNISSRSRLNWYLAFAFLIVFALPLYWVKVYNSSST